MVESNQNWLNLTKISWIQSKRDRYNSIWYNFVIRFGIRPKLTFKFGRLGIQMSAIWYGSPNCTSLNYSINKERCLGTKNTFITAYNKTKQRAFRPKIKYKIKQQSIKMNIWDLKVYIIDLFNFSPSRLKAVIIF